MARRLHRGSERYSKFAKALLISGSSDDFYRQSLGFEIIPEINPYTLHAGAQLPVRVWFRGEPAVDLQLEAAWYAGGESKTTIIGRTDAEGRSACLSPQRENGVSIPF